MEKKGNRENKEHYRAVMLLAAVGDAMGYRNGSWEFNKNGETIHREMMEITQDQGALKLRMDPDNWRYSDDTVMHIATAEALVLCGKSSPTNRVAQRIA